MIQIPKNVMQIGEINPHTKIYMEDYVHTFLERRKTSEVYLAFGKKEEQNGALYYMIYGVEKKTDWDRGSLPYFRKYDRLGTIQGPAGARTLKPVRADSILLDGYFIFYEQNEDMQAYMIAVRETEEIRGSEEKEAVMESNIADYCNLSCSHLRALFKRETGVSIRDFLVKTRLAAAAYSLRQTEKPILEIAFEAGFGQISCFNRLFRKIFGVTPREYRRLSKF